MLAPCLWRVVPVGAAPTQENQWKDEYPSIIAGALVVASLRVMDRFLPKGRMSKRAQKHSIESKPNEDDEEDDHGRSL